VPALTALAGSRHEVPLVITQPTKPRGRGREPVPTPVGEAAERLGLTLLAPASINTPESLQAIWDAEVGALLVVAFGQILREPLLSDRPCINVHFSLLPEYRGAAPVERAIMDGRTETGVTIMQMDPGLDTGPIAAMQRTPIGPDDDAGAVTTRLAAIGADLLVQAVDALEAGEFTTHPQPDEGATLAPKIGEDDRTLDFSRPAEDLERQVRALSPHIGAGCLIDGQRFKIWKARARTDATPDGLSVEDDMLVARCGAGALELLELQPPNRSRMTAGAFLRGWRGALELGRR
jgi:methionyl-tRNA formyltransferase